MKLSELIEESIVVLKTNKMRTGLSALGIIIGIGSVIALMTLGQASQQSVKERIQSLGSNLLTIRPGAQQSGFIRGEAGGGKTLTYDDALEMQKSNRITTINEVASQYSSRSQISFNGSNMNVEVSGVTPNYFSLRSIKLGYGALLSQQDMEGEREKLL